MFAAHTNRIKLTLATSLLIIVAILLTPFSSIASALSGSQFSAGNIISDSIFFNSGALTSAQIQSFLNSKVPVCNPGYTCLKDYRQDTPYRAAEPGLCSAYGGGNKSSTEIIYDVAQVCGINPEVLLVLLQKEQSLVTDTWPESIQYRSATGFGCPDTAACDSEYYGFFNQVYNAARIYRKYARDAANYNYRAGRNNNILYNPNAACGSSTVYIVNQATANLYNYTPYQPNAAALNNLYGTGDGCSAYGNRNFWRLFNDWFGSSQASFLVRTPSNPTYYLLTNGVKYAIPSGDILYAYGLERQQLDVVSDAYLNTVPNGGMLGTLFTVPDDQTVFLADGGKKYGIASGDYCVRWGLSCGDSSAQKVIGHEIFDRMGQGGVLQAVMQNRGDFFLMEGGVKKYFPSAGAIVEHGYTQAGATPIINWTNAIRNYGPSLPESNTFLKFASSSAIYLYTNGSFFSIPDYETFLSWYGTNGAAYLDRFSSYNTSPPATAGTLSTLEDTGSDKYLIDNGRRIDLTAVASNWPAGSDGSALSSMLSRLPISATAQAGTTFRIKDGAIYQVTGQQKRPFNSVYDYLTLNTGPTIQLSTTSIPIPTGPVLLAEGSAYKINGSNTIYLVGSGNKSYAFTSVKQISDFGTNMAIPNIPSSSATQFTYQQALVNLVKDSHDNLFAINNGARYPVSASAISNWGFSLPATNILSDSYLARLPTGSGVSTFLGAPNGTIYTYGSGTKRPIATYDKYKALGGNSSNTLALTADVIDALPTGPAVQ